MIEATLSVIAAAIVFLMAVLRLNILRLDRHTVTRWSIAEVLSLACLMGGCAGVIGEWFLENAEFHAETIVMASAAVFAVSISRGQLCQVVARLQGWDGGERRSTTREAPPALLTAEELLERRQ